MESPVSADCTLFLHKKENETEENTLNVLYKVHRRLSTFEGPVRGHQLTR